MTTEQSLALDYFKNFILTTDPPDFPKMSIEQKQEAFDKMPENMKLMMVDMIIGYSKTGHPAFAEILEQRKKNHSDMSFGMIIKGILSKHKL